MDCQQTVKIFLNKPIFPDMKVLAILHLNVSPEIQNSICHTPNKQSSFT